VVNDLNINLSLSSAEGMTKILFDIHNGAEITKNEVLSFLNEDSGCINQFKFYGSNINKEDYLDMFFSVVQNKEYTTENFILQKMYSALKKIYSNLDLLNKKLDNIKKYDFRSLENKLASTLPANTELNLNIFFCLDGFNGGSIVDSNTMCLDVLFWPSKPEMERQIEGVILHEFHHIGLLYWLEKDEQRKNILNNKDKISLAVKLVEGIMGEGAAIYFFNDEQDLYELVLEGYGAEIAEGLKGSYLDSWNNFEEKLSELNKLLSELLDGTSDNYDLLKERVNEYSYSKGNKEALDKVIGKYMCSVIVDEMGKESLIDSFINPKEFLICFNDACEKSGRNGLDIQVINRWKALW